eukprot:Nitzschia sp. Nitz4//scaffold24_size164493//27264//29792//NITZ4_002309-RA/size164493-processed-gene-0.184-mRNA-1//1//CDS//3329544057//7079//frame0
MAPKPQESPTPGILQDQSVLAGCFVPTHLKAFALAPASVQYAIPGPPDLSQRFMKLFSELVMDGNQIGRGHNASCSCGNHPPRYPWADVVQLPWNPTFAISPAATLWKNKKHAKMSPIEHVKDKASYISIFSSIMMEEYTERLLLYERYSSYSQVVRPTNKGLFPRTVSSIQGIHDVAPPLEPGDVVLMRPHNYYHQRRPAGLPPPPPTEIVATVITTQRASKGQPTDTVVTTYMPHQFQKDNPSSPIIMTVRFLPSATYTERCQTALNWLVHLHPSAARELLFPTTPPKVPPCTTITLPASLNPAQATFVKTVLARTITPTSEFVRPPLLLTGPAGTGKTSTLLKAVLQVLKLQPTGGDVTNPKRILICTPSHTACDVITRKLAKELDRRQLFRLYDPSRSVNLVPADMFSFARQDDTGAFTFPSASELLQFTVIVCTCQDAHLLYMSGFTNASLRRRRTCVQIAIQTTLAANGLSIEGGAQITGANTPHFTHLFLDEAAQATEPETLIPLSVVVDDDPDTPKVEIALAGDPRQLRPTVYCSHVRPVLSKSLLERLLRLPELGGREHMLGPPTPTTWTTMDELLEFSFQTLNQEQPPLAVFLPYSYRGHPAFLHMPSKLFYADKLRHVPANVSPQESEVEEKKWSSLVEILRDSPSIVQVPADVEAQDWPIHFRAVHGEHDEVVSASRGFVGSQTWYNPVEASVVSDIVQRLCQQGGVGTEEIGVMAAFRMQAVKIRLALRERGLGAVNVGTVEDYQAVERKIIVLSLTRSKAAFLDSDEKDDSGLFRQPKRMNVALTRSEKLLVVVGNPNIMQTDPCWSPWLDYCRANGLWYNQLEATTK